LLNLLIRMRPQDIDISLLKTGDVFLQHTEFSLRSPTTWFAYWIREVTKSKRNHTSECIIIEWKPYMIESLVHWVSLRTRDDWLKVKVKRDFKRLRYSKKFYDNEKDYLIRWLQELDKTYDWHWILRMFIFQINGDWNTWGITSESEWRCSEFTAYMKNLPWREHYSPKDFENNKDFISLW